MEAEQQSNETAVVLENSESTESEKSPKNNLMERKRALDGNIIDKIYTDWAPQEPIREGFLKRLETFDVINWCGKPVDPPTCAQFGWQYKEEDILECTLCHQVLSVELPPPSNFRSYAEACQKLESRLQSAHTKYCLYLINPSPSRVRELERLSLRELEASLAERISKYHCVDLNLEMDELPEVNDLFPWFAEKTKLSCAFSVSVFALVLTGWDCVSDEENTVRCKFCKRKWLLEKYITQAGESDEPKTVNPITQHLPWCAWRNPNCGWLSRFEQLHKSKISIEPEKKRMRLKTPDYASISEGMKAIRQMLSGTP